MIRQRSHIQRFSSVLTVMLVVGAVLSPTPVHALNQSQYTTTLPFTSNTVAPNILLVLDNSGSMDQLASRALPPFNPNTDYSGIFDARQCYQYQAGGAERFRTSGALPKSLANDCPDPSHPWDGSLLNYVSMTRMDIAKVVMTGGRCEGARNAAGACPGGNLILTESNGDTISIPAADAANRFDPPPGLIPGRTSGSTPRDFSFPLLMDFCAWIMFLVFSQAHAPLRRSLAYGWSFRLSRPASFKRLGTGRGSL